MFFQNAPSDRGAVSVYGLVTICFSRNLTLVLYVYSSDSLLISVFLCGTISKAKNETIMNIQFAGQICRASIYNVVRTTHQQHAQARNHASNMRLDP